MSNEVFGQKAARRRKYAITLQAPRPRRFPAPTGTKPSTTRRTARRSTSSIATAASGCCTTTTIASPPSQRTFAHSSNDALRKFGEDVWIVEGPPVRAVGIPLPTCMIVVRVHDGLVWINSPVAAPKSLLARIEEIGPPRYLAAPTPMHLAHEAPVHVRHAALEPLAISTWVADVIPRCLYGWVTCITLRSIRKALTFSLFLRSPFIRRNLWQLRFRAFAADIRPLFTQLDRDHMMKMFGLWKCDDVKASAAKIYEALKIKACRRKAASLRRHGTAEHVTLFKSWMDGGLAP